MQKSAPPATHSSMASSSSSHYPPRCPLFPTISEHAFQEDDGSPDKPAPKEAQNTREKTAYKHYSRRLLDKTVNYNKCPPSNYSCRGKSFFSFINNASLHLSPHASNPSTNPHEENWKLVASELSEKLLCTTRQRDEALAEVSQFKQLVSEMGKKLSRLDVYCHDHKFFVRSTNQHTSSGVIRLPEPAVSTEHSFPLDDFLQVVQESRSTAQKLGRSLLAEIHQGGLAKSLDQIGLVLETYKIKVTSRSRSLLLGLEALLNQAFYVDFESTGFKQGGSDLILDPYARCISNHADYEDLKGLNWEDVLNNGTRCHSQGLSSFCDRKINTVVNMLRWEQVWGESLLHDFFSAAKSVWLVHLLCHSVHPALPIFRVEKGHLFESRYMEDIAGDHAREPADKMVRLMVAPGFYVYKRVIKCKVMCAHNKKNKCDHKSNIM